MNEYTDLDFMDAGRLLAAGLDVDTAEFERLRKQLGIGMRRARYWVKVWEAFGSLDVEREMLLAVGWTKLQLVAHVVTPKNARAWIIFLMGHSVQEVRRAVDGKLPLEKLHCLMFYLPPPDYEIVAAGLKKFGASQVSGGLVDKEHALVTAMAYLIAEG